MMARKSPEVGNLFSSTSKMGSRDEIAFFTLTTSKRYDGNQCYSDEIAFLFFLFQGDNQDLARVSDRLDPIHPILSLRPCGLTINFSLEERRERKIRGKMVGRPKSILE